MVRGGVWNPDESWMWMCPHEDCTSPKYGDMRSRSLDEPMSYWKARKYGRKHMKEKHSEPNTEPIVTKFVPLERS